MTTLIETSRSGVYAVGEAALTRWKGENINSLRYALSIYTGLGSAFPDYITEAGGTRAVFASVNNATPFFIALNELADLGESAYLKVREGTRPYYSLLRLNLRTTLRQHTERQLQKLLLKQNEADRTRIEKDLRRISEDFVTLSSVRESFRSSPEDMEVHLNLDSAIFECGYLAVVLPEVLGDVGVSLDISKQSNESDKDYLTRKYGLFLRILNNDNGSLNSSQRALLGMHLYEMGMKVVDDGQGREIDQYTGVISFYDVVREKGCVDISAGLKTTANRYFTQARELGMSPVVMKLGSGVRTATRQAKLFLSRFKSEGEVCEPDEIDRFLAQNNLVTSSDLRHRLEQAGVITGDIFVNPKI